MFIDLVFDGAMVEMVKRQSLDFVARFVVGVCIRLCAASLLYTYHLYGIKYEDNGRYINNFLSNIETCF